MIAEARGLPVTVQDVRHVVEKLMRDRRTSTSEGIMLADGSADTSASTGGVSNEDHGEEHSAGEDRTADHRPIPAVGVPETPVTLERTPPPIDMLANSESAAVRALADRLGIGSGHESSLPAVDTAASPTTSAGRASEMALRHADGDSQRGDEGTPETQSTTVGEQVELTPSNPVFKPSKCTRLLQ
jgi:hypothetical protein